MPRAKEIIILDDGEGYHLKAKYLPLVSHLIFKCDDPECCGAYHINVGAKWESVEACLPESEREIL